MRRDITRAYGPWESSLIGIVGVKLSTASSQFDTELHGVRTELHGVEAYWRFAPGAGGPVEALCAKRYLLSP